MFFPALPPPPPSSPSQVGGGDQLYNDDVLKSPGLQPFLESPEIERLAFPWGQQMQADVRCVGVGGVERGGVFCILRVHAWVLGCGCLRACVRHGGYERCLQCNQAATSCKQGLGVLALQHAPHALTPSPLPAPIVSILPPPSPPLPPAAPSNPPTPFSAKTPPCRHHF